MLWRQTVVTAAQLLSNSSGWARKAENLTACERCRTFKEKKNRVAHDSQMV